MTAERVHAYRPVKASASRFVDVRGLSYHVRTWGDASARKLFLLHGWMDVSASFQFMVDALVGDWHVLAPDWRGFGLSETPQDGYWFLDYVADLDALVRALATSRSQLHRKLQAEHGLSPGELITRTRLRAAAELLAAGRGSVTEVCYSVGFRSLSSFSRAFKLAFGCNPGEYADRARRAVPEPTT